MSTLTLGDDFLGPAPTFWAPHHDIVGPKQSNFSRVAARAEIVAIEEEVVEMKAANQTNASRILEATLDAVKVAIAVKTSVRLGIQLDAG